MRPWHGFDRNEKDCMTLLFKLDSLDEIAKFLEIANLSRLTQEGTGNLNRPAITKETGSTINTKQKVVGEGMKELESLCAISRDVR